jgi:putative hydrolase of the HAD superfamily
MGEFTVLLWDVGGVILSNAWDHADRKAAAQHFDLDPDELELRHEAVAAEFETDKISEGEYLSLTVFYEPRSFTREAFQQYMRDRSVALPSLALAKSLRRQGKYVMAALNNESKALNEYRIATFGLREAFQLFLTSCYTGRRKPEPDAYRYALEITQSTPGESLFLDDRLDNVKAAASLGIATLWVRDPERLREEIAKLGIATD